MKRIGSSFVVGGGPALLPDDERPAPESTAAGKEKWWFLDPSGGYESGVRVGI